MEDTRVSFVRPNDANITARVEKIVTSSSSTASNIASSTVIITIPTPNHSVVVGAFSALFSKFRIIEKRH